MSVCVCAKKGLKRRYIRAQSILCLPPPLSLSLYLHTVSNPLPETKYDGSPSPLIA